MIDNRRVFYFHNSIHVTLSAYWRIFLWGGGLCDFFFFFFVFFFLGGGVMLICFFRKVFVHCFCFAVFICDLVHDM